MVYFPELVHLYDAQQLTGDSANNDRYTIRNTHQYMMLLLTVRAKNGATRNSADAAAQQDVVEAIENITIKCDGKVVKEYTGEICRRIAAHELGVNPYQLRTQAPGGTWDGNDDPTLGWDVATFPIIFTPKEDLYGDKGAMLPAPLFESVDLYLKYDFTVSATAGFVTGAANHVFDLYGVGIPAEPTAVMQQKSILLDTHTYDWTTEASGNKEFDLTLNNTEWYRRCFVHSYEAGIGEGVDIDSLKLLINGKIYQEATWGEWQQRNARERSLNWEQRIYCQASGTDDEIWTRVPAAEPLYTPYETGSEDAYFSQTADKLTINGQTQDDNGILTVRSKVNPCTAVIDFDSDGRMLHMLSSDPAKSALAGNPNITKMQLRLVQTAAGGTTQIVEQRVIKAVDL